MNSPRSPRTSSSRLTPTRVAAAAVVLVVVAAIGLFAVDRLTATADVDPPAGAASTATNSVRPSAKDPWNAYRTPGWIAAENAKPGTTDWYIPDDRSMWSRISGYADATSIDVGDSVVLRVSTAAPSWQVSAYRIGFYGGPGGRLVWRSDPQTGVRQPAPTVDAATKTWTAGWAPSLTLTPDPTWPPGQYLLRLESSDGGATFVPLVLRDDASTSDLLLQSAVTTWQAYNAWGGASLYTGGSGRADVVSFDRPYTGNGSGEFLGREYEMIHFIERLGLDVSYWTNIDLHERGELARNHRAIVIPGHDEYYTLEMRRNLEAARDAGVNIGFFGANNVYRRIRLGDATTGTSRLEIHYRDARRDPLFGKDDSRITTTFREAPSVDPESSLTGSYYECNPVSADWVVGDASMWMFAGSGFRNGDKVPGMVGNEYDRVTQGVPTPSNIQVLSHSPVTCKGKQSFANSTWYSAPSGAGVFTAGTFGWSPRMITPCPPGSTDPVCKLQIVTENLLRAFAAGPAGAAHPSVSNLARFSIPTPRVTTPTAPSAAPAAAAAPTTTR